MRRFSSDYLRRTRRGMWEGDTDALAALRLAEARRVLDVGCGDGGLTHALADACGDDATVVGCDGDPALLRRNDAASDRVVGDAYSLPFADSSFDVVVCQALLVNLRERERAVREFRRVCAPAGRVGCVEPDNSEVRVESTVGVESDLARRTRRMYLDGVGTDVALGADASDLLRDAGIEDVTVRRYDHELVLEPPYGDDDVRAVRRKATADPIRERRSEMAGSEEEIDALREEWRSVGREAARQMEDGDYRRREVIPFYVVVGKKS